MTDPGPAPQFLRQTYDTVPRNSRSDARFPAQALSQFVLDLRSVLPALEVAVYQHTAGVDVRRPLDEVGDCMLEHHRLTFSDDRSARTQLGRIVDASDITDVEIAVNRPEPETRHRWATTCRRR